MSLNSQTTVSVIIPVYNGSKFVKAAIDSVLGQTYKNIEIIVIDDGSTDDSRKMVESYRQAGQVKYIYQANRGLSGARNAGIRAASGKYLKFLDCDDFLYPKQIELQVEHLRGKTDLISFTDHLKLFDDGSEKARDTWLDEDNQLAQMIASNFMPVHSVLVESRLVVQAGGFDEELTALEDADLWLRLLLKGARIGKVNYVGCCYRIVNNSLSSNADKMFLMRCKVSEKLNALMLPRLKEVTGETLEALLAHNTKLIDGCFARKLDLKHYLSTTLLCTQFLTLQHKRGFRKKFFKLLGCQPYMQLKYYFNRLRFKGYQNSLIFDEIKWRK